MSDTRERFLREIAERLPPERVSELHLFPPLRQGGIESGVAVVAAAPDELPRQAGDTPGRIADAGAQRGNRSTAAEERVRDGNGSTAAAPPEPLPESFTDREVALRAEADDERAGREEVALRAEADDERPGRQEGELADQAAYAYAPEPAPTTAVAEDDDTQLTLGDALGEPACDPTDAAAGPPPAPPRPRRHTVYTARYRHTLKGPDRGKWEFDLVAEADAPLITVETVVRGVQKRIGEMADPERLTPDELRAALDDTPWRATTG